MSQHRLIAENIRPERQLTRGAGGRILTNTGVWSADGEWIVYDTRSDAAGAVFDGRRIEMVHSRTGEVRVLYESGNGAHCGVAAFHPREGKVVFIHGPEKPDADWSYGPAHRQGVMVDIASPGHAVVLDARDLTPPFTSGALRGGSHVHVWDAAGERVSFTYNDALVETYLRDVAVSLMGRWVKVLKSHARNHDGEAFTVLITRSTSAPRRGSDDYSRACEEGWVGNSGYAKADSTKQRHALAFQGQVLTKRGESITEVFIADLPENLSLPGEGPLSGRANERPYPPYGVSIRRLTRTAERKFPGLQGPRHWLRTSPDGTRIAFLMKDDMGIVQLWTISPNGGEPAQLTDNALPVGSAFSWSSDGRFIAHLLDGSVCVTDSGTGRTTRLTPRDDGAGAPRPEACVFSPDGGAIAFVRRVKSPEAEANQICVVDFPEARE